MMNRRAFLQGATLTGAAFGLGLKFGFGGRAAVDPGRLVLHAFLPADEAAVRGALAAFLAAAPGRLPVPACDAPPPWREALAAALRTRADDFTRGEDRALCVQVTAVPAGCGADLLLQDGGRILDPASEFGRELLALRAAVRGRPADVAFTAALEPRRDRVAGGRVLTVETERGLQERIPLAGPVRTLAVSGPAGRTLVEAGAGGARVVQASCRHQTCRLQGVVAHAGALIACAPNRLLLRVETA